MAIKLRLLLVLALTLVVAPATGHAGTPKSMGKDIIGTILEVEGSASINTGSAVVPASVNAPVRPGYLLSTGPNSRMYVLLIDNTELTLSENGQMEVNDYVFNPQNPSENRAEYSVMKGAFLYVSGLVAKKKNPDVNINIPEGSIGIRGTRFWGGNVKGSYGVVVGDGEVEVKTKRGKVRLKRGQGTNIKKTIAGAVPSAAAEWAPETVQQAVATVTFEKPEVIGERMKVEKTENQPALRAQHLEVQKLVLAEIKQEVATVNPELAENLSRQDLLTLRHDIAKTPDTPIREIIIRNADKITLSQPEKTSGAATTDKTDDVITGETTATTQETAAQTAVETPAQSTPADTTESQAAPVTTGSTAQTQQTTAEEATPAAAFEPAVAAPVAANPQIISQQIEKLKEIQAEHPEKAEAIQEKIQSIRAEPLSSGTQTADSAETATGNASKSEEKRQQILEKLKEMKDDASDRKTGYRDNDARDEYKKQEYKKEEYRREREKQEDTSSSDNKSDDDKNDNEKRHHGRDKDSEGFSNFGRDNKKSEASSAKANDAQQKQRLQDRINKIYGRNKD